MPQEDVDVVRRFIDALNARDLDTHFGELLHPEVEWRTAREDPDATTHRGRDAYMRYVAQWIETFDGLRADIEECIDAGDGLVYMRSCFTGAGRASGAPADWYLAINFTIRDGKVVRGEEYSDRDEALEAAGLSKSHRPS